MIGSLSPDIATEVHDTILTPPTEAPYTKLKEALITQTTGSSQQKHQKLLNEINLGDRKPSQLLHHMQQLWSGPADNPFLRELFLQCLPSNIHTTLVPLGSKLAVDKLAEMADRIMEMTALSLGHHHSHKWWMDAAEVNSLRAEARNLQDLVQSISVSARDSRCRSPLQPFAIINHPAPLALQPVLTPPCAGIINGSEKQPPNVANPAAGG